MKNKKDQLTAEVAGYQERLVEYYENLKNADVVRLVVGCDDARVGVPSELQTEAGKKVMYVYVPKIGGGLVSQDAFEQIIGELKTRGVESAKIEIILTQHGSTEEINDAFENVDHSPEKCTCGLRGVFKSFQNEFAAIRAAAGDKNWEEVPAAVEQVEELHKQGLPRHLVAIAALHNFDFKMFGNGRAVLEQVKAYGLDVAKVDLGYFDHNQKVIHIVDAMTGEKGAAYEVAEEKWHENYQDPACAVISFGPKAMVVADSKVLPDSVGERLGDNFSSYALETVQELLQALSESWYAENSYNDVVNGTSHHGNFENLKKTIILCDDQAHVKTAKQALASEVFIKELKPAYAAVGSVELINLENGEVEQVDVAA